MFRNFVKPAAYEKVSVREANGEDEDSIPEVSPKSGYSGVGDRQGQSFTTEGRVSSHSTSKDMKILQMTPQGSPNRKGTHTTSIYVNGTVSKSKSSASVSDNNQQQYENKQQEGIQHHRSVSLNNFTLRNNVQQKHSEGQKRLSGNNFDEQIRLSNGLTEVQMRPSYSAIDEQKQPPSGPLNGQQWRSNCPTDIQKQMSIGSSYERNQIANDPSDQQKRPYNGYDDEAKRLSNGPVDVQKRLSSDLMDNQTRQLSGPKDDQRRINNSQRSEQARLSSSSFAEKNRQYKGSNDMSQRQYKGPNDEIQRQYKGPNGENQRQYKGPSDENQRQYKGPSDENQRQYTGPNGENQRLHTGPSNEQKRLYNGPDDEQKRIYSSPNDVQYRLSGGPTSLDPSQRSDKQNNSLTVTTSQLQPTTIPSLLGEQLAAVSTISVKSGHHVLPAAKEHSPTGSDTGEVPDLHCRGLYYQSRYNVVPPPPPLFESAFAGLRDIRNPSSIHEKQIVSVKGTVRGFKNRVRAGIATFWAHSEDKIFHQSSADQPKSARNYRQLEHGRIVVYGTSMSVVRETSERCRTVRRLLQNHMVRYEERDLYMSREYQQELRLRLINEGILTIHLPHVFADGIHIGGAEELEKLNEAGELRGLLDHYQKVVVRFMCEKCGGYRFIPCEFCHGSKRSLLRNHFTEEFCALRCMHCDDNGLRRCNLCADQQE